MIQGIQGGWNPAAAYSRLPVRPQGTSGGATAVAASASRDVSASLSITTKEGDTVSISASFDATASYAGVRGRGGRASAWNVSTSSQFSLQVQGNLSEQEMKDISRVVKTFMHDLRAMLKGRDVSVANVAGGDPQTLQSVSANASTSTTFTGVAVSVAPGPAVDAGLPGNAPPQRLAGEDSGPIAGRSAADLPRGIALPLPAPEPVTLAGAASPA
jgi:hypothetical protein